MTDNKVFVKLKLINCEAKGGVPVELESKLKTQNALIEELNSSVKYLYVKDSVNIVTLNNLTDSIGVLSNKISTISENKCIKNYKNE